MLVIAGQIGSELSILQPTSNGSAFFFQMLLNIFHFRASFLSLLDATRLDVMTLTPRLGSQRRGQASRFRSCSKSFSLLGRCWSNETLGVKLTVFLSSARGCNIPWPETAFNSAQ